MYMKRIFAAIAVMGVMPVGLTAEKKYTLKELPAAIQKGIEGELKGGEIKNISKETEHGVTQYEVESMLNGKHRDFNVDTKGSVVLVEEEIAIEAVPAPAQAAIRKKVADGTLGMVETFVRGGTTAYEAAYQTKAGRKQVVLVKADGTSAKN
jgi:hypothetical protein